MKIKRLLPLFAIGLLLSGCGKTADSTQKTDSDVAKEADADSLEDSKTKEQHKDDVVEGNGSYFVSINDKVYFRKYDADTFSESSLNGEKNNLYIETINSKKSEICIYDPESNTIEPFAKDNGYGEIYYLDGLFYLNKYDGKNLIYTLNIDTGKTRTADNMKGKILSLDDKTGSIVTRLFDSDANENSIFIYKDGKTVNSRTVKSSESSLIYLGTYDGKVYYYQTDEKIDDSEGWEDTFWEYDLTDNKEVCLGKINPVKEANNEWLHRWVEELIKYNDKIYISYADYEGTPHWWNAGMCLEATSGKENSLDVLYDVSETKEGYIYVDANGKVDFSSNITNGYTMSENELDANEHGDLLYYESATDKKVIAKDFIEKYDEACGFSKSLAKNTITKIGDKTYMMLPSFARKNMGDIGWRHYYKVLSVDYLVIDGSGKTTVLTGVNTSENYLQVEVSYEKNSDILKGNCVGKIPERENEEIEKGEHDFTYNVANEVEYIEDGQKKTKDDFIKYIGNGSKIFKIYFNENGQVNKIEKV